MKLSVFIFIYFTRDSRYYFYYSYYIIIIIMIIIIIILLYTSCHEILPSH